MDLIAITLTLGIIANQGTIGQAEGNTVLLTDAHTIGQRSRAVAGLELGGIGIGLDGGTESLGGAHAQVLDVVCIQISGLSAGRTLGNTGQTVPGNACAIVAVFGITRVKNAAVDANLIQTLGIGIPFQSCHRLIPP